MIIAKQVAKLGVQTEVKSVWLRLCLRGTPLAKSVRMRVCACVQQVVAT